MKYPCEVCLTKPCCQQCCDDYYNFINYWADNLCKKTADEIHEYRMNVPVDVLHKVTRFINKYKRYQFVNDKNNIGIITDGLYWSCGKRGTRSA